MQRKNRWWLRGLLLVLALATGVLASPVSSVVEAGASSRPPLVGRIRWGYYVAYDEASFASVRAHIGELDYLSPYWLEMDGAGGLSIIGDSHRAVVKELARQRGVALVPMVKNSDRDAAFHNVLANPATRQTAISNLVREVLDQGYDGIHIDFEALEAADRPYLTAFMQDLAGQLRPRGKLVTQAVAAKTKEQTTGWSGVYDYAALGQYNDLVVVMAYAYRSAMSANPGSVAPQAWVDAVAEYSSQQISTDKLLLGVALWGYDWDTTTGAAAQSRRYPESLALARAYGAAINYDTDSEVSWFVYWQDGHRHEVWYEDRRSVEAKLDVMERYGLGGAATWRMGHEDPTVWEALSARLGFRRWYLAEGATVKPFHTWLLLMNPNPEPARAQVVFMLEGGATIARDYQLPPQSRTNIFANQVVPNAAFATQVVADHAVFVERAMYFGHDGHDSPGANSPRYKWFLPQGRTAPGWDTWVLLMNPNSQGANVKLTFLLEGGGIQERRFWMPPTSRLNVWVNLYLPQASFSTIVEADRPVVAERTSYFDNAQGGHGSGGSAYASRRWYLAEGYSGYDSWLLLMNPGGSAVSAMVRLLTEAGTAKAIPARLAPMSRQIVDLNVLPGQTAFGITVEADGPVVAERVSYWGAGTSGHTSLGAPAPARRWYLAEGSTASPFSDWVLVINPGDQPAQVDLTFMLEGGGTVARRYTLGGGRRLTVNVGQIVPNAAVSVAVSSDQPVVAERSMYFGAGGHNALGVAE